MTKNEAVEIKTYIDKEWYYLKDNLSYQNIVFNSNIVGEEDKYFVAVRVHNGVCSCRRFFDELYLNAIQPTGELVKKELESICDEVLMKTSSIQLK